MRPKNSPWVTRGCFFDIFLGTHFSSSYHHSSGHMVQRTKVGFGFFVSGIRPDRSQY